MNKRRRALKARIRRGRPRSGVVPLDRCALYGVASLTPLAKLLWQSNAGIRALASNPSYARWIENKPGRKPRQIQDPRGDTEKVHYRIFELLDRVARPSFLHSATRGRSYVTNARSHIGGHPVVSTDMRGCFEATTVHHVAAFFKIDLRMAGDLAWKLARICCADGHLPTGSCLSPLLAYWVHRGVFAAIAETCAALNVTMSVYIDDVTFSGEHASLRLLFEMKQLLAQVGLQTHKDRSYSGGGHKVVTGVAVGKRGLQVPNRRLHEIVQLIDKVPAASETDRAVLLKKLQARVGAASAISRPAARALRRRLSDRVARPATTKASPHTSTTAD